MIRVQHKYVDSQICNAVDSYFTILFYTVVHFF